MENWVGERRFERFLYIFSLVGNALCGETIEYKYSKKQINYQKIIQIVDIFNELKTLEGKK